VPPLPPIQDLRDVAGRARRAVLAIGLAVASTLALVAAVMRPLRLRGNEEDVPMIVVGAVLIALGWFTVLQTLARHRARQPPAMRVIRSSR
jgi:uncharacterized membrane protein